MTFSQMISKRVFVILVVVSTWCLMVQCQPVATPFDVPAPCSSFTEVLTSPKLRVTLTGTRAKMHAYNVEAGHYDENAMVAFQWPSIKEQYAESGRCSTYQDSVIRELLLQECICSPQSFYRVDGDYEESGFEIKLHNCPSDPQFVATAYISIANSTKITPYNTSLPFSTSDHFTYTHPSGGVKFGFTMQNWTYSTAPEHIGRSYLVSVCDLGVESQYATAALLEQTDDAFIMNATIGRYLFKFTLEMGFILDGNPAVTIRPSQWFPIDLPGGTNGLIAIPRDISFCEPMPPFGNKTLTRWKEIYYDPSLTVLFDPSPVSPDTPPSKKSSMVAVAVAVPILACIIVGGILILLVVYVPAFRVLLRPFSKERTKELIPKEHVTHNHNNAGEWKTAEKPVFVDDSS